MDLNKSFDVGNAKAREWMTKHPTLTGTIFVFFIIFLLSMFSGSDEPKTVTESAKQPEQQISKDEAQKELAEFMALSKVAGLITSYEFSEKATEVFVGSFWYTQKVEFKKDFIAKIGLLKKAITGYAHFEARDAYSNEKVAEITAFSQSVEIYK
ncbi:MAG: hypothetical protein ABIG99_01240 [Patescibacteria group bacterium]